MIKSFQWRLIAESGDLIDPIYHGPYYNEFVLNEGPFDSVKEAEDALEKYHLKYLSDYESECPEQFVLLTVYSAGY